MKETDKKKIIKVINQIVQNGGYFDMGYVDESDFEDGELTLAKDCNLKEIETVGGEVDGAEMSMILQAEKDGEVVLFRIDGYYSSWDSNQFDDSAYEVEEYIKKVKDWKKV